MIKKQYITHIHEYESANELGNDDGLLVKNAIEATEKAYAPYSKFRVGACVLLANGKMFTGNNQENAAYPSGLCAERVAIFYANSEYPDVPVKAIAVAASNKGGRIENPVPPCGSCRQVLLESETRFKNNIKVILVGEPKIIIINNVKELLPLSFEKGNLFE